MAISDYIIFHHTTTNSTTSTYQKNTKDDWHLIPLTKLLVNPPPLKTNYVNYDANSGALDLTQENGLDYGMRTGKWQFKLTPGYDIVTVSNSIMEFLHGGYFEITMSTDSTYKFYGRVTVDEFKSTDRGDYITLGYILEPFKRDTTTQIDQSISLTSSSLTQTVNLAITRMKATPYIKVTALGSGATLTINWYKPKEDTLGTTSTNITITSADTTYMPLQASDIVIQRIPGGFGYSPTSTTTPIKFTVSSGGSATIRLRYVGGWL